MRRALYAAGLTGLFLLLLSALVVTPESPEPVARWLPPAEPEAVFRPVLPAALPQAAFAAPVCRQARAMRPAPLAPMPRAPWRAGARDANGRVLSAVRYENSVYQLFRAEIAGG